ncbi:Tetratricopeptide repeat [Senna tora]|uniref:Tetratricopeptide repeat n=1 Tax=Senna tora TaxID=362788 RepID=A0A834X4A5_9FABA|nr:Tetratricopeptide repeat [Senna tora]
MDDLDNSKSSIEDDSHDHQLPLRTAPSFAIYNAGDGFGDEDTVAQEVLKRTITIGQSIDDAMDSGEFSFDKKGMDLIEEDGENEKDGFTGTLKSDVEPASPPMYLAAGLGVDTTGFGFDNCTRDDLFLPNLDGSRDVEEYYNKMVEEYPCHPFILRNYAQILQSKGDLHGAENYFLHATLADPNNGEILVEYAKLIWDLYHDKERAMEYFERAAQAASPDSDVLAAYASFLWEIEDDGKEGEKNETNCEVQNDNNEQNIKHVNPPKQESKNVDIEDYFKKMIEENPTNPLFLKNYAQFLIQSRGDLNGAEECLSRATLADPDDGEILMQYAKLVWDLHQDKGRALCYFERAAKASPSDSHILAAYASFLWETEDDEDEGEKYDTNSEQNDKHEQYIKIVKDGKVEIHAADITSLKCEKDGSVKDYYKKMIDENPDNSSFLKSYALFLIQSKKDLKAAEEYYSRAIVADPGDGEMISEYAKLEWELHRDWRKALSHFEQAVQATPENSNVLAAYACFLWETEDGEAEISR